MSALTRLLMTVKPPGVRHTSRCVNTHGVAGQVAQLVEQGIENPRVGGSIPSLATTTFPLLLAALLMGCGDNCERLCTQLGNRIATCKPDTLGWLDLGATSRADFVSSCRDDWERVSGQLTTSDLRVALDVCQESARDLDDLSCEEVSALYLDSD